MKRVLFFTSLLLLPILAMAQGAGGQVKRPVKKQQAETIPPKKKGTKNLSSSSTKPKAYAVKLHMYEDKNTGKYGYTDDVGNIVVPPKYDSKYSGRYYFTYTEFCFLNGSRPEVGDFYDEMALVADSCGYGFIDKNGKEVIKCQYMMALPFSEGLAAVEDKKTKKWGYINKKGEVVIPFLYRYPRSFTEGYAFVEKEENKWAYIDKRGHNITPWEDSWTGYNFFVEGRAQIKRNGKYGYIDYGGKTVIPCVFDHGYFFMGKYAIVQNNSKYGVINRTGKYVVLPKYDKIDRIVDSYVFVQGDNKKEGVVDVSGNQIIPFEYSRIRYAGNNIFIVGIIDKSGRMQSGFIHANGSNIWGIELEEAYGYKMGLAPVRKNGKWGFIDKKGALVIPFKYDDSRDFDEDGMAFVKLGNLWASIDVKGNVITPFGDITQANIYRAEARKKLKSGIK